jgi:hypothetical protein
VAVTDEQADDHRDQTEADLREHGDAPPRQHPDDPAEEGADRRDRIVDPSDIVAASVRAWSLTMS